MNSINKFLEDITESEKQVFINSEHYNHIGRKTRVKILELARDIENGFFAEIGACMGTDTKLLEEAGWKGILIEPSEGLYEFCKKTRKCIVENYALVSNQYNSEKIEDIPVFSINHILEGYPTNSGVYKTTTFDAMAKKHNIRKIDIFVLDTEGSEEEIIRGINFENIEISNFIIECNLNILKIEEFDLFMSSLGYKNMGIAEDLGSGFFDYHYKK